LPRPIETLLSFPRVRLIDRVPILETQQYVRRFAQRIEYHPRLVKQALSVSKESARQFSTDEEGLSTLLREIDSAEYIVTRRSRPVMEEMLSGICADGRIFEGFEDSIQPLCEISPPLRDASTLADRLADKAKEESLDVARALLLHLPTQKDVRFSQPVDEN
jgi:hypothetical protein